MFSLSAEACSPDLAAVVVIPSMSFDGISTLPMVGVVGVYNLAAANTGAAAANSQGFVSQQCGGMFGAWGTHTSATVLGRVNFPAIATNVKMQCLVCKYTLNHTTWIY